LGPRLLAGRIGARVNSAVSPALRKYVTEHQQLDEHTRPKRTRVSSQKYHGSITVRSVVNRLRNPLSADFDIHE
jgi:hypothetical protein